MSRMTKKLWKKPDFFHKLTTYFKMEGREPWSALDRVRQASKDKIFTSSGKFLVDLLN